MTSKEAVKLFLPTVIGIAVIILAGYVAKMISSFDNSGWIRLFLLTLVYIGGGIYVFVKFIIRLVKVNRKPPPQRKNTDHGSAEWATREQFVAAGNDSITEGLWLGDYWRRKKSGHLLTVAGSGAGKNTCLIIPNLLINPSGSYVVTDPKGENATITARNQREYGQRVFILDPWEQQQRNGARHGIHPAGFNPFDFIKADPMELRDNCELIAYYLIPDNPDAKDPYWDQRARALIKTILLHIVTYLPKNEHSFWTLYKMLRFSGDNWLGLLIDMKNNDALDGLISASAEEYMGLDPAGSTFAGIRSNAQNATTIFESPQLRASLEKSEFNPYELANGNCTVYIVIPERYLQTHSAWLRLVVGLCLKAVNSRPKNRVNFLLDEFAVMGKMRDVRDAFAFARGQNIVMWAFVQSLSQLKETYGEDGMNTFIGNTSVFQAFGIKDQYTKEYVSNMLGDTTIMTTSLSVSTTTGHRQTGGMTTGTSIQSQGRKLLTPEEVEKLFYIITITEGLKFCINRYAYFHNRYEGVDWRANWLTKEQQKLIKEKKLPPDLRETFAERADPPPRILA